MILVRRILNSIKQTPTFVVKGFGKTNRSLRFLFCRIARIYKVVDLKRMAFALIIIFSLAAPVATSYVALKYQRKMIKKSVKRKLINGVDKEELVFMKFTEIEKSTLLNWKHSKEFEFKGEMYDIVDTFVVGDTTCYWLWWDYEETQLNRQLDRLLCYALGTNHQYQENQERLLDFLKSLYFSDFGIKIPKALATISSKKVLQSMFYQSIIISPIDPPPKAFRE